jgi:predicted DNA repair protein MutK
MSAIATRVVAASMDDIASQTAKSLPKTAGLLIDDAATIPQFVDSTAAKRELPVIYKIAKKSITNKAIMIPIALLITYFAPWVMTPILVLGGSYLAFEGSESLAQRLGLMKEHSEPHDHSIPGTEDLKAAEDATVSSAVKTDTVLSIEIIAITVASVVNEPITTQVGVLILISIIATFAVYGVVGIIIKMDDIGFYIKQTHTNSAALNLLSKLLIQGMPVVLKMLGTIGMVAMLMVGGGILIHNLSFLHGLVDFGSTLPSILPHVVQLFASPVAISLTVGASILVVKGLVSRAKVA